MAKLTKAEARRHNNAVELLQQETLTEDDKRTVLESWNPSAEHINGAAGAFFTPPDLAQDITLDVGTVGSVLDLCAGIGALSLAIWWKHEYRARLEGTPLPQVVCVEQNPEYVRVGRKLFPEATWIQGSVFDLPATLDHFDVAVSNPPFGRVRRDGDSPGYTGAEFEYHVVSIAAQRADRGVFVLPQGSLPWAYSGRPYFTHDHPSAKYQKFHEQTGIDLEAGCGIETTVYEGWLGGVSPTVEIANVDFATDRSSAGV